MDSNKLKEESEKQLSYCCQSTCESWYAQDYIKYLETKIVLLEYELNKERNNGIGSDH